VRVRVAATPLNVFKERIAVGVSRRAVDAIIRASLTLISVKRKAASALYAMAGELRKCACMRACVRPPRAPAYARIASRSALFCPFRFSPPVDLCPPGHA